MWPEPDSQYFVCGIWIALSSVQSACGIMHGGKRLFFSPLHATVVSIYSGEGNIWMSWVTKFGSKPVPAHWNQLCHSGLKVGQVPSPKSSPGPKDRFKSQLELGPEKMYAYILCCTSCPAEKLSRTYYPLHLWTANSSFPGSCQHRPLGFFLLTSSISSRDTGPGARPQPQPAFDPVCSDVLLWARMDKVFLEEPQTRLYSHCWNHGASLCPTLKMNAKGVLIPCVPPTLS